MPQPDRETERSHILTNGSGYANNNGALKCISEDMYDQEW